MGAPALDPSGRADLLFQVISRSAAIPRERVARSVLRHLEPGPDHALLEVGFGKGRLLAELAARVPRGFVAGIDPSELMQRHARIRCRRWIESGRLHLELGTSADLGAFPEACFDAVVGVHVVRFWEEPGRDLAEIRRVLRPGGRLLLGHPPGEPDAGRVTGWLREAGFAAPETGSDDELPGSLVWTRARR
jgi:ubiquinone/menaquinone biosynthesis C-methylase UbiE